MTSDPHGAAAPDDAARVTSTGAQLAPTERSVVGALGAVLIGAGLRGGTPLRRLVLGSVGAGLAAVAATGRHPLATALKIQQTPGGDVLVRDAVTVQATPEDVYRRWRDLATLPQLMTHLRAVEVLDDRHSRWTVAGPTGDLTWDAELTADEPGERLAWQSLPGAAVDNAGEVQFRPAPGDRGTEVLVRLTYRPPGGSSGAVLARVAGEEPAQQLRDDLTRFRRELELGFAPTTEGQSSGRAAAGARP